MFESSLHTAFPTGDNGVVGVGGGGVGPVTSWKLTHHPHLEKLPLVNPPTKFLSPPHTKGTFLPLNTKFIL